MNRIFNFFLLVGLLFAQSVLAQKPVVDDLPPTKPGPKVYQLSGLTLNKQDGLPVSYTRIVANRGQRFGISNEEGFFSVPVIATDTIVFTRIGYKPAKLSVGSYLANYKGDTSTQYLYVFQYLYEDSVMLPTVTIRPYQTAAEVKTAIANMNYDANNPMALAGGNVSPELMAYFTENLPVNEKDRQAVAMQRYNQLFVNGNTAGLDPVAVYNLIRHVKAKTKEKKDKNYSYWPED